MTISNLKRKYIGKSVYAGGKLNGVYGRIVDIRQDIEDPEQIWFYVSQDNDGCISRWDKSELQELIVTTSLVPLK